MDALISIVVPVFNSEKYLKRCINSLIKQEYEKLEIILIDDGSTDNSGKICDNFKKKDNRIKVIHKKNEGVSNARNDGIRESNGKYIAFIDSDDYVEKCYIKNLHDKIEDNIIICENATNIYNNHYEPNKAIKNDTVLTKNEFIKEILKENLINGVCWGKLYITEIVKKVLFNPMYRIAEDLDFNIRYLEKISGNCKIIKNTEYYYFINESSTIHSEFSEKWYDEIEVCKKLIEKYKRTKNEIYCIKRFMRINSSCLTSFKTDKNNVKKFKNNIKLYKKIYISSEDIEIKDKFKLLLSLYFSKTIYILKKWRNNEK